MRLGNALFMSARHIVATPPARTGRTRAQNTAAPMRAPAMLRLIFQRLARLFRPARYRPERRYMRGSRAGHSAG